MRKRGPKCERGWEPLCKVFGWFSLLLNESKPTTEVIWHQVRWVYDHAQWNGKDHRGGSQHCPCVHEKGLPIKQL